MMTFVHVRKVSCLFRSWSDRRQAWRDDVPRSRFETLTGLGLSRFSHWLRYFFDYGVCNVYLSHFEGVMRRFEWQWWLSYFVYGRQLLLVKLFSFTLSIHQLFSSLFLKSSLLLHELPVPQSFIFHPLLFFDSINFGLICFNLSLTFLVVVIVYLLLELKLFFS